MRAAILEAGLMGQGQKWRRPMLGLMQRYPLLISSLIVHAARHRGGAEVVSNLGGASLHRTTYVDIERRSRRLARVLAKLGVGFGDRVATLAWNDYRHLELYYGVSGMGAVCHAVNPRLAADDIAFIISDAQDCAIFADPSFAGLLAEIAPSVNSFVRPVVLLTDEAGMPDVALAPGMRLYCYETLMAEADENYVWPEFDRDRRPLEGRHQVGRRVDQLDRAREHRRVASGRGGGRDRRRPSSEVAGAPAAARRAARRRAD